MARGEEGWVARLPAVSPCQQRLGAHAGHPAVPNGAAASWALPGAPRCAAPSLCWLNSAGLLVLAQRCHGWGARGECGPTARGCPDAVPGLPVPGDRGLRGLLGSRAASPGEERRGLMKIGAQTSEQTVMFFSPCNDSPGL